MQKDLRKEVNGITLPEKKLLRIEKMSLAVQGVSLKNPQYLTRTEWYDLTETCLQSPSRALFNLLRNTKLIFFALKEHCAPFTYKLYRGYIQTMRQLYTIVIQDIWYIVYSSQRNIVICVL